MVHRSYPTEDPDHNIIKIIIFISIIYNIYIYYGLTLCLAYTTNTSVLFHIIAT